MKPRKFGFFDGLLAVLIIAAVVANVAASNASSPRVNDYYGYNSYGEPTDAATQTATPPPATSTPQAPTPTPEPAAPSKSAYAGDQTPTLDDFYWYTNEEPWPEGTTFVTDFDEIKGYWKAYEEYVPRFEGDGSFLKLFNAVIGGDASRPTFTYDMTNSYGYDGETGDRVDVTAWHGDSYAGEFGEGILTVGDVEEVGVKILITEFYSYNGKQYAKGIEAYIDGGLMFIALVRP